MAADYVTRQRQITVVEPDVLALMGKANAVLLGVEGLVIDGPAMYELAGAELVGIKTLSKAFDAEREKLKKPILKEGREIDECYRGPLAILAHAAVALTSKLTAYRQEQQRIADAEQAKREREAREERERLAEQAKALEAAGRIEEAEAVAAQASITTAVQVVANVPKVAGIASRKVWKGTVVDMRAFLHYVADHEGCWDWIEISAQSLNRMATTYKTKLDLPGVVAEEVESTTART